MITRISITFGTKAVLETVIKKYPDRQMLLLDTSEKGDQLALLDVSGQPSVFASPVHYDIKLHRGTAEWRGFFNFMYFNNLSPEDQKTFNAKASQFVKSQPMPDGMRAVYFMKEEKNWSNNIIFSIWDSADDYLTWKRTASFTPFSYFTGPLNNFHAASYHHVNG